MSGFALTFSLLCLGQKCSVIHLRMLRMLQHCLHRPACSFFWIVSYFSILHKWFLMESLNEEMSNQLWKMNIKHLCKVPYIKQESPQASRYYLSILCWFYMPVYSSKKKPKQPNIRYLGNVVMLSSDIQTKFSRHTDCWSGEPLALQEHDMVSKFHGNFYSTFLSYIHLSELLGSLFKL